MKKLLLLVIVLSLSVTTKAQVVFCPPGTEWHYTFLWPLISEVQNVTISYTGDTIIGNETLKILSPAKFYKLQNCKYASRTLIRQRGDTIFMNNTKTQNTWQILYNYAATVGQGWTVSFIDAMGTPVKDSISVDSITLTTLNNFQLKTLHVKYWSHFTNRQYFEMATIVERLGCTTYLFNHQTKKCASDADQLDKFLCYRDNEFGLKQFTDTACGYRNAVGINEPNSLSQHIHVYPNPVKNFVTVNTNFVEEVLLSISDLQGRVLRGLSIKEKGKIDLSDLNSGIYLITIIKGKEIIYAEKFIRE